MKFTLDESRKHRLVGVVVILSIIALFLPAFMKKSSDGLNSTVNVAVHLPQKPAQPSVSKPNSEELFQTVKVAKVDLSEVIESEPKITQIVKAEPIRNPEVAHVEPKSTTQLQPHQAPKVAKATIRKNKSSLPTKMTLTQERTITPKKQELAKQPDTIKNQPTGYAVQIASFAVESNAKALVQQLRHKGYKATYSRSSTSKRELYKVIVGQVDKKEEAKALQQKLAESIHLKGFVIKTGVS
ncbi:SPOR domain-containing protein [Legionella yabuuchiae]|uniref:SPOR domain-containing protein n=1 Tax=Legionella yabuuchiae TaxID=376727 RepID=UPI001054FF3F|nr:SPOR domain-containing protein [Legionella yabuuchiae]